MASLNRHFKSDKDIHAQRHSARRVANASKMKPVAMEAVLTGLNKCLKKVLMGMNISYCEDFHYHSYLFYVNVCRFFGYFEEIRIIIKERNVDTV